MGGHDHTAKERQRRFREEQHRRGLRERRYWLTDEEHRKLTGALAAIRKSSA